MKFNEIPPPNNQVNPSVLDEALIPISILQPVCLDGPIGKYCTALQTVLKNNRKKGKAHWSFLNREKRGAMEMSPKDSPRTPRRHIDWIEQPEKSEKINVSPLHLCQCVLQYFEFVAIWLEEENVCGIR